MPNRYKISPFSMFNQANCEEIHEKYWFTVHSREIWRTFMKYHLIDDLIHSDTDLQLNDRLRITNE